MKLTHLLVGAACLSLIVSAGIASAQGKVTREQAWAQCLKAVDQAHPATESGDNDSERIAAFKACMTDKGYPAG